LLEVTHYLHKFYSLFGLGKADPRIENKLQTARFEVFVAVKREVVVCWVIAQQPRKPLILN
jgi:hypothetical protein